MNYINQTILDHLRSGSKTAEALKDVSDCSYSVFDQALRSLIDADDIEIGWSTDNNPVRIYKLERK